MKNHKLFLAIVACALSLVMLFTACASKDEPTEPAAPEEPETAEPAPEEEPAEEPAEEEAPAVAAFDEKYAIQNITLCGTDTNDPDFMKGFSMMGTIGDLIDDESIFSVAMCYSTADVEEVKAFFTSERFSDPASFLAEVDTMDLDGNIRNLAGDKLSYLDGAVDNPIRFYGDGIDLINNVSLLQNAGEYHFYMVTMGYESVLWVGEADKTFTIEQSAIDLANDFAAAYEVIVETELMTDVEDVSGLTQEEKTQAVLDYFTEAVDALDLGVAVAVEYDNNPDYPDDYVVTLSKDGVETFDYVPVYFGAE